LSQNDRTAWRMEPKKSGTGGLRDAKSLQEKCRGPGHSFGTEAKGGQVTGVSPEMGNGTNIKSKRSEEREQREGVKASNGPKRKKTELIRRGGSRRRGLGVVVYTREKGGENRWGGGWTQQEKRE